MNNIIDELLDFAVKEYNVKKEDIYAKDTHKEVSFIRSIIFRYLNKEEGISMNKIAKHFNRKWRAISLSISKSTNFNKADERFYQSFVSKYKESHPK